MSSFIKQNAHVFILHIEMVTPFSVFEKKNLKFYKELCATEAQFFISGFFSSQNEVFALMDVYAVLIGSYLTTLRYGISGSF